jgi:long-subunit acyl-CoA synthetase (AMP-forming)
VDDVLILANGEKVVPAPIEGKILAHPFVHGVLAFGRERSQVGVLVEPTDERALAAYRNSIWPAVEEANRVSPAFGRVHKEMILVTSPSKLLPRAAKGTVTRKAALALYEAEINAL